MTAGEGISLEAVKLTEFSIKEYGYDRIDE
jgi:hypothetical protein